MLGWFHSAFSRSTQARTVGSSAASSSIVFTGHSFAAFCLETASSFFVTSFSTAFIAASILR